MQDRMRMAVSSPKYAKVLISEHYYWLPLSLSIVKKSFLVEPSL
jgi:hypothetical protein